MDCMYDEAVPCVHVCMYNMYILMCVLKKGVRFSSNILSVMLSRQLSDVSVFSLEFTILDIY